MRFLTSADQFRCIHGAKILVSRGNTSSCNGKKILTKDDLMNATVTCTAKTKCVKVTSVSPPFKISSTIGGEPVLQGSMIMTNIGPVRAQLGQVRSPVKINSPAPYPPWQEDENEAREERIAELAGVYAGGRALSFLDPDSEIATHLFILVIPGKEIEIPESFFAHLKDLGGGIEGFTLGGQNTNQHSDILELVFMKREDFLVAEINEEGDFEAASRALAMQGDPSPPEQPFIKRIPPPGGTSHQTFVNSIIKAFENYKKNVKDYPIEYPISGGLRLFLLGQQCYNSNSWVQSMVGVAKKDSSVYRQMTFPDSALCSGNQIPTWFFQDNRKVAELTTGRRKALKRKIRPPSSMAAIILKVMKESCRKVADDEQILSKPEAVVEDLASLFAGDVEVQRVQPNPPEAVGLRIQRTNPFSSKHYRVRIAPRFTQPRAMQVHGLLIAFFFGFYQEIMANRVYGIDFGMMITPANESIVDAIASLSAQQLGIRFFSGEVSLNSLPAEFEKLINNFVR